MWGRVVIVRLKEHQERMTKRVRGCRVLRIEVILTVGFKKGEGIDYVATFYWL